MKTVLSFIILTFMMACEPVLAWGGRGHHVICEAATFLVQEKALQNFLRSRSHTMGHLCNIPDTYWKSLGGEANTQGYATHFIDMDILPIPAKEFPLDYKVLIEKYTGTKNVITGSPIHSIPKDLGSSWWRADQFYRLAVKAGKPAQSATVPANNQEEQNEKLPYNQSVYSFYVNLGLMGHFVGDNSQPYHLVADYDGYAAGHGGIHSYYEEALVSALPATLTSKVVSEGKKLQQKVKSKAESVRFLTEKSVVAKMKAAAEISLAEIKKIEALDKVIKPSEKKSEKGMSLKTPAERQSADVMAPKFEALIVSQMARAASLLAHLWDQAYIDSGRPQLTAYRSYDYPFTPEFVAPDYFDLKLIEKKSK